MIESQLHIYKIIPFFRQIQNHRRKVQTPEIEKCLQQAFQRAHWFHYPEQKYPNLKKLTQSAIKETKNDWWHKKLRLSTSTIWAQYFYKEKSLLGCCFSSSWLVWVVAVVMLSKSPDILDKEHEFLVVALCFLQTPRTLFILLFISIYGIGSVYRIIKTLDRAHVGTTRPYWKTKPAEDAAKTDPIKINHLNNQTKNPKKKENRIYTAWT